MTYKYGHVYVHAIYIIYSPLIFMKYQIKKVVISQISNENSHVTFQTVSSNQIETLVVQLVRALAWHARR